MGPTLTSRKTPKSWWSPVRELWSLTLAEKRPRLTRGRTSAQLKTTTAPQSPTKLSSGSPVRPLENNIWSVLHTWCLTWMMQHLSLLFLWCTGSPLWSKERNEAVEVQKGVSLVLQCRPPAGLPPPIIFWMDNSGSTAYKHICTLKQQIDPRNLCLCQTSIGSRWTNGCHRLWMVICTSPMSFLKTAGLTTSVTLASLTHKPSSRSSPFRSPCWTVSQGTEDDGGWHFSPF